jgi:hypothetical protein
VAVSEYVGSGGRKASFAAIRLGNGGQQNRQQSSLKLKNNNLKIKYKYSIYHFPIVITESIVKIPFDPN